MRIYVVLCSCVVYDFLRVLNGRNQLHRVRCIPRYIKSREKFPHVLMIDYIKTPRKSALTLPLLPHAIHFPLLLHVFNLPTPLVEMPILSRPIVSTLQRVPAATAAIRSAPFSGTPVRPQGGAIATQYLADIEKRWEEMEPPQQAELWMQLRDRMKESWHDLSVHEKKACTSTVPSLSLILY